MKLLYLRADSLDQASLWAQQHPQAVLLAGGQTLLASIQLGLSTASHVIDLQDVPELHGVSLTQRGLEVGAMTTHAQMATHPLVLAHAPMLSQMANHIADAQVRAVGTIGGSLVNHDPAACWPAALLAMNAAIVTNRRTLLADDFFTGFFQTALQPGEVVVRIVWAVDAQANYQKFEQSASRFALVGVAVARLPQQAVRVAITGLGNGVVRWPAAEAALQTAFAAASLDRMALAANAAQSDVHASADYRVHLARVLAQRCVQAMANSAASMPTQLPRALPTSAPPAASRWAAWLKKFTGGS